MKRRPTKISPDQIPAIAKKVCALIDEGWSPTIAIHMIGFSHLIMDQLKADSHFYDKHEAYITMNKQRRAWMKRRIARGNQTEEEV